MVRQCRKYELPWRKPSQFLRRALLPMRVALLGAEQPWMGEDCRQIMTLNFAEDRDIDSPEAVAEILAHLGLPATELIDTAQSAANKLKLREQTTAAESRGIFGTPTFFVQDEMFWGNDRLDDALDFAARQGRR